MRIAVLGLGYVGITAAACLASRGHSVIGIDPNPMKVEAVQAGRSPITEPGLDALIANARDQGLINAKTALDSDVSSCELAIVCVGTPSAADGSHNMTHIADVTRQLAELVRANPRWTLTIAYRSTIRPGTVEDLIQPIIDHVLAEDSWRIEVVYNPEFLRESSAVDDFFSPPKIVVGTKTGEPCHLLDEIHEGIDAPRFNVRYRESEITKFVDNSFHAVKTVFANEIGRLCVKLGINASDIYDIFVADTKLNISEKYLRPGGAFGGSCLPKDVRALQHMSRSTGEATFLIDSLIASNEAHKSFLFEYITRGLDFGSQILVLGIAFKDKSDDLRESPNIDLVRMLITAGHEVSIHDPYVAPQNLVGQNLGVLTNSPFIEKLLIDSSSVEGRRWDLVVDTRGISSSFPLGDARVIDINRLM